MQLLSAHTSGSRGRRYIAADTKLESHYHRRWISPSPKMSTNSNDDDDKGCEWKGVAATEQGSMVQMAYKGGSFVKRKGSY